MGKSDLLGRYAVWSIVCSVVASFWTIGRLNHRLFDESRAAGTMSDDL